MGRTRKCRQEGSRMRDEGQGKETGDVAAGMGVGVIFKGRVDMKEG